MSWESIGNGRDRQMAENPEDEIAAMQHPMRVYSNDLGVQGVSATAGMRNTRIIMPLDCLYDHQNVYTIIPYCNGGEIFDRLDRRRRFTEDESRHFSRSILDGL